MALPRHAAQVFLAALAACGPPGPLIVVQVSGAQGAASGLALSLTRNDRPADQVERFPLAETELELLLPADSAGKLALQLDAVDCRGCAVARAVATQWLLDRRRYDVPMTLAPLPAPICPSGS